MLIKEIPTEERPRERLLKYGSNNLSNEDTEEIILDVFLILWQNKNKLDINKNMSSYIGGVTKNLVKLK